MNENIDETLETLILTLQLFLLTLELLKEAKPPKSKRNRKKPKRRKQ